MFLKTFVFVSFGSAFIFRDDVIKTDCSSAIVLHGETTFNLSNSFVEQGFTFLNGEVTNSSAAVFRFVPTIVPKTYIFSVSTNLGYVFEFRERGCRLSTNSLRLLSVVYSEEISITLIEEPNVTLLISRENLGFRPNENSVLLSIKSVTGSPQISPPTTAPTLFPTIPSRSFSTEMMRYVLPIIAGIGGVIFSALICFPITFNRAKDIRMNNNHEKKKSSFISSCTASQSAIQRGRRLCLGTWFFSLFVGLTSWGAFWGSGSYIIALFLSILAIQIFSFLKSQSLDCWIIKNETKLFSSLYGSIFLLLLCKIAAIIQVFYYFLGFCLDIPPNDAEIFNNCNIYSFYASFGIFSILFMFCLILVTYDMIKTLKFVITELRSIQDTLSGDIQVMNASDYFRLKD